MRVSLPFLRVFAASTLAILVAAGCGGSSDSSPPADAVTPAAQDAEAGIRLVSATDGAAIQANPPDDLVILDVRTPEEFAEGHLDGAVMIDFYREDFAAELAELDPNVPYLLYCRSGNRSGQTAAMMKDLGFADVADIDGGILSWTQAEFPTVSQ